MVIPINVNCEYCNKDFNTTTSLKRHQKDHCNKKDKILKEEIKKLKEENKLLKQAQSVTIDNSTNYIIVVNNYENTSLDKLTDKDYNRIINGSDEPYQIIPNFIKYVHFNDKIPENNNIRLSNRNKNNKHVEVYRDNHWQIMDKNAEIGNLIADKETNISDWIIEKEPSIPKQYRSTMSTTTQSTKMILSS